VAEASTVAETPTATTSSTTDPAAPLKARQQLIEWTRTALPTVVGAIGLTGFVSILGGALIWVRFSTAALPADQAVGELPTSSLLVTGAVSLVLYLVLGLAAVALVYLLQRAVLTRVVADSESNQKESLERAPDTIKALEREQALTLAWITQLTARIAELAPPAPPAPDPTSGDAAAPEAPAATTPTPEQMQLEEDLRKQLTDLGNERLEAGERADKIARALYDAELKVSRSSPGAVLGGQYGLAVLAAVEFALIVVRTDAAEGSKIGLIALLALAVALGVGFGYGASAETKHEEEEEPPARSKAAKAAQAERDRRQAIQTRRLHVRWITAVIALGAAGWLIALDEWTLLPTLVCIGLTGANYAVSRLHPTRFFWLGISIFVSVVLFGAVLTYSRSNNAPSAQPAAVLLKDGCTAHGLWIGESSDRVYLAHVTETNIAKPREPPEWQLSEGRIFWVSRSQVASESVGTLQRVRNATLEAPRLEMELSSIQAQDALTTEKCKSAAVEKTETKKPDPPKPRPPRPKPNRTKPCRKHARHRAHRGRSA
jgi:hypothetical protein